jgi:Zn-dependent protease
VPVDFNRLRQPKKDMLWVAAAGPAANLFMALCWALMLKLAWSMPSNDFTLPLSEMSKIGIIINCVLMVLNLLPLPPLDGGRIAVSLLPHRLAWQFAKIEPWGFPILLVLLFSGILNAVMNPLVSLVARVIESIFGLY